LAKSEKLLFNNSDELDILKALIIYKSHNAFSKTDHLYEIQNKLTFNLDEDLQNKVKRNVANELIYSFQKNNFYVKSQSRLKC